MRESMSANSTEHGSVNAVKKKNSKSYNKNATADHAKSTSNAKIQSACYRCGSPKHKANFKSCPALGQTCGKRDHYAKVCLAEGQPKVHQLEEVESESDNYVLTVDPSDKHDRPCPRCIVKIQDTPINVLVDSGSPYTIIPKALYDSLFSECKLHESDISPGGYGGSPIAIQGFFKAALQYKDRSDTDKVHVSKKGATILGWSAQSKLRIVLDPTCNDPVLQTSNIVDQYSEVFEHDSTKISTCFTQNTVEIRCETHSAQSAKYSFGRRTCRSQGTTMSVIEPIEASEWVSPIVVAHKPDGRVRLCIDLRNVNSKIIVERYPMPNIHKMLSMLESAKVFITIDLSSAYHQIPLTDESKDITAFITTEGLFRFMRIPFGLASASSVFQRMMHNIFKDVKGVSYFQDDILIHAKDQEEHDKLLHTVLARLKENGLTVQQDKCKFNQTAVDYLGHTVTPDAIKPKESLVTAVVDAPAPQNKEQLDERQSEFCLGRETPEGVRRH